MKILKRGALVAAMAAASVAMLAGSASAAITPDPYSTSTATGRFTASSPLGPSSCTLSGIVANGTGTATGGVLNIRSARASCSGVINSATVLPTTVTIASGNVTANVAILVATIAGNCLYTATLRGTIANGGNSATVTGVTNPPTRLGIFGICSEAPTAELSAVFPGVAVTW